MRDDGQMIILTGLIVCLFLVFIGVCLSSVSSYPADRDDARLSREAVDNALWAQEAGLSWNAAKTNGYSWDQRYEAARAFRDAACPATEALEKDMQRRGIAYSCTYDDNVARAYVTDHPAGDAESIGGIIVRKEGGSVKIAGCCYHVQLSDGSAEYETTRLVTW